MTDNLEMVPVDWTGVAPPDFPPGSLPQHVAIVMDGNGRWANARGLPRVEGHRAGETALLDVVAGAIQAGVSYLSVYAFSTENWNRSPDEVRFLMGFNRDVLRRRRDQLAAWNVRIKWSGRAPKLWSSVISDLTAAQEMTKKNTGLTLSMCVNYGGRAEIVDAVRAIARDVKSGRQKPDGIRDSTLAKHLYVPGVPNVDLFIRTSGEKRTSNFLLWQSAYAEMVFVDTLWPDMTRETLWETIDEYSRRTRRFGSATDAPVGQDKGSGK